MGLNPAASLAQAISYVRAHRDRGIECPCCGQYAKVYRRKLNSGMTRSLIEMYRAGGTEFIHLPTTIGARSREEGKLRWWGLVEEQLTARPDGGRAGYWRVTHAGELFVRGRAVVEEYAEVYNNHLLGLGGAMVDIRATLGSKFNYDELMKGS